MSYAYNVKRGRRAAQARAKQNKRLRETKGEAYIHMTPLGKWGFDLRAQLRAEGR